MGKYNSIRDFLTKHPDATNEEIFSALSNVGEVDEEIDEAKTGEVIDDSVNEQPVVDEPIAQEEAVQDDAHDDVHNDVQDDVKTNQLQTINAEAKSITDIGIKDVKVTIDHTKAAGEQVKEVIDYAATVGAIQDESTVKQIAEHKKEELVADAEVKAKGARKQSVQADTEVQRAKRAKFQLLFDTFGVADHIPDWLLKILMCIFAPFYVLFVIVIGIPTGFVRFLTDCVDGILVRYDRADDKHKPKIKVTVWVVLALAIAASICLTLLKCFHVI